jgi:hypothetical protein
MIKGIVIPADVEAPVTLWEIRPGLPDDFRAIVGGHLEAVMFDQPRASLYINEEGKLMSLPVNQRATALTWAHNSAFRGLDVIAGDAVLVGPPDDDGDDQAVPEAYVELLFNTELYRTEYRSTDEDGWFEDPESFDNWYFAYVYAVDMAMRHRGIRDVRVIAAT